MIGTLVVAVGLRVLSGRPDMVSGGSALLEISGAPPGITWQRTSTPRLWLVVLT